VSIGSKEEDGQRTTFTEVTYKLSLSTNNKEKRGDVEEKKRGRKTMRRIELRESKKLKT